LDPLSKCIIILLQAVHDCPGGRTAVIAHHMSFAQIACYIASTNKDLQFTSALYFINVTNTLYSNTARFFQVLCLNFVHAL